MYISRADFYLGSVYTMDHEVGSWKDGLFPWVDLMVKLPWSNFFKISIYRAFGPLTSCKPNVDQEEWPCTKKWLCLFFEYMPEKDKFRKNNSSLTILLPSLVFIFSSPKTLSLENWYNNIFLLGALAFSTRAPILPLSPQNMLEHVSW